MGYREDSERYAREYGLVVNRVSCLNWVVEDRATVRSYRGDNVLTVLGRELARWRDGDINGVHDAFVAVDALFHVLWDCRREGFASFV